MISQNFILSLLFFDYFCLLNFFCCLDSWYILFLTFFKFLCGLVASIIYNFYLIITYSGKWFGSCCLCTRYTFVMNSAGLFTLIKLDVCDLTKLYKRKPHLRQKKFARVDILHEYSKTSCLFPLLLLLQHSSFRLFFSFSFRVFLNPSRQTLLFSKIVIRLC